MQIIILNGSPRSNGATAQILKAMEQQMIQEQDVDIEYINLGDLKIDACRGCCSCYKTGTCFLDDDAELLSQKIASAEGVIIGSPTYASNISGVLKQFIDRGHFVVEQLLHHKYAISVVTGENYGNRDASNILIKLLKYSGASLSGNIVHTLPFNADPLTNQKLQKKVNQVSKRMITDIRQQKKYLVQRIIHSVIFNVGIKPFVMKKGDSYSGVMEKWKRGFQEENA